MHAEKTEPWATATMGRNANQSPRAATGDARLKEDQPPMPRTCFVRTIVAALSFFFILCSLSLSDARECSVKIIQHGQEITPVTENGMATYKLRPDTFRIEVDDFACSPGIFSLKTALT